MSRPSARQTQRHMEERRIRHGYGHDDLSRQHDPLEGGVAYHLRRHRKLYGGEGISQKALAMVAHVSRQFVEKLETSTDLQDNIESVVRVAIAVGHPVEELIAPGRYSLLREEVERRRRLLGGAAVPSAPVPAPPEMSLAVTYRAPHLMTAVSDGKTVLDLRQRRVTRRSSLERLCSFIDREARTYGVREVVVETDTKVAEYASARGIPHRLLAFDDAKRHVLRRGEQPAPSDKDFFHDLLARHPEFGRFVRVLPATGRVAVSERWRTSRLVVAALALAAPIARAPNPAAPPDGRSLRPRCIRP